MTTPLTIAYIGNTRAPWCSEVHIGKSLTALGHTVRHLQEDELDWSRLPDLAAGCHLVLWTRTWAVDNAAALAALARLRDMRVPTVSYHLDRWWGLDREYQVTDQPFFRTDLVVSPDGANDHRWEAAGVNHLYLPPGVYAGECGETPPNPRLFPAPVVFVGSLPYPHKEWAPVRQGLVDAFRRHFGRRFATYPVAKGRPIRGRTLQALYATAQVVLGDSCLAGGARRYWCVDEATEALTADGWQPYDRISPGDLLYTLNPESGLGEWQPAEAVSVWPAERRTMWAMEGERHSSLTTLDHRWFVERHRNRRVEWGPPICPECGFASSADDPRWGVAIHRHHLHGVSAGPPPRVVTYDRKFVTSAELIQSDRIPLCAPASDLPTESKFEDALVELVAWSWTEGSWSGNRYRGITQSHRVNGRYVARIRACLFSLFGAPRQWLVGLTVPAWAERRNDDRGMTSFALNAAAGDVLAEWAPGHVVPAAFIRQLTAAQLRLFVETSIDADGCRKTSTSRGSTATSTTLAQKDPARLDSFEMACALLGQATNRTWHDPVWIVHVKRRNYTAPLRQGGTVVAKEVEHDGVVWCPTTRNGTWLARRRGTVYFTGNSDRIPETLGRGGLLIHPDVQGLDEWYVPGKELLTFAVGDHDAAIAHAEWALANPAEAREVAAAGRERVLARDTYAHRMTTVLDHVEDAFGFGPGPLAVPSVARSVPTPETVRVAHRRHRGVRGEFALAGPDSTAVWEVWQDDTYRLDRLQIAGQAVVDIGAHVGSFAVLAAKLGATRVDAYEPVAAVHRVAERNVAHNGQAERVTVHHAAVGGHAGTAHMAVATDGGAHLAAEGEEVPLLDINDVIGGPVGLLKIDCEGGEYDIIAGMTPETLQRVAHIVMEFHGPGMPHLRHLEGAAQWGPTVAKLAEYGHLRTLGRPSVGGLLWWDRY